MSDMPPRKSPTRLQRLRRTIMAGLTIIVPLWLTGWVLKFLFDWADGFSTPLINQMAKLFDDPDFHIPGLGFVLTFIILWVVGALATNVVGRSLWQFAREMLEGLPLVRTIYAPIQQLVESLTSPGKAGFEKVVLVEYPRIGMWTLGFLAGNVPREDEAVPAHSIFVPTAPNPTTGFMLIVPPEQLRPTELRVEEALKMIVSAGVAVPPALFLHAEAEEKI
ncbi:MAG: DUF502 domain-containing protein [Gemmatimonadetes bacterium]|nr:DUF502 domain-containing protein [Gemmatimonadota bacterium]MYB70838.1 DUF502 domain-containing protein [Gemmatimonadota bacterium]